MFRYLNVWYPIGSGWTHPPLWYRLYLLDGHKKVSAWGDLQSAIREGETKVNRCLLNPQLSCASLFLSAHNTKVKKRQEQNLMKDYPDRFYSSEHVPIGCTMHYVTGRYNMNAIQLAVLFRERLLFSILNYKTPFILMHWILQWQWQLFDFSPVCTITLPVHLLLQWQLGQWHIFDYLTVHLLLRSAVANIAMAALRNRDPALTFCCQAENIPQTHLTPLLYSFSNISQTHLTRGVNEKHRHTSPEG